VRAAHADPTAPSWVAIFAIALVVIVAVVLMYGSTRAIIGLPVSLVAVARLVQVIAGRSADDGNQ
jgi:hypothetical protein